MKRLLISLAAALVAGAAFAQAALPKVQAEVRRVDAATQKITLKHGDIPNIDMGAMTMAFRVKDPALLEKVKAGDKVVITADKVDGNLTVMSIELAKP
ncbi:MAG: copper-binding protein [Proteobacteria bacterium]|nr:copper-binding protein [Pseudomonadota bacterium]